MSDTIFALSSGALPSGVAIVRISGSQAFAASEQFVGKIPYERGVYFRSLYSLDDRTKLDEGMVLTFVGPQSFTGEDVVELQLHGSKPLVARVLNELAQINGLRAAEPGEFSKRSFENGRMDLTQVEGLADLLAAQTERQREVATTQHAGKLRQKLESWREQLIRARGLMEAEIDFADEDDVPDNMSSDIRELINGIAREMRVFLDQRRGADIIRDGYKIALVGEPNVGKSTLLNALIGRDAAIVTDIEGTTRDIIEAPMQIGGILVLLQDTAGLRETTDAVEKIGIQRTLTTVNDADLVLALSDTGDWPVEKLPMQKVLKVQTKTDLKETLETADVGISAVTDVGIKSLLDAIALKMNNSLGNADILSTRLRHFNMIEKALSELSQTLNATNLDHGILADHLRAAADAVGSVTGHIDVDQVLDIVFSEFCVGK